MAHESVGLGSIPGRKGIGAKAGVDHSQMALVLGVEQVRIKGEKLVRGQHALVNDDLGGQRANVE